MMLNWLRHPAWVYCSQRDFRTRTDSSRHSAHGVFHGGHGFIAVHLQSFAVVAGLPPVQLRRHDQTETEPRGEVVKGTAERDKEEAGD